MDTDRALRVHVTCPIPDQALDYLKDHSQVFDLARRPKAARDILGTCLELLE